MINMTGDDRMEWKGDNNTEKSGKVGKGKEGLA